MSEFFIRNNEKIELMKNLLVKMDKDLISPDEIKREFKEILSDITPADIAIIENVLITKEGFPAEKIHNLCDTHIEIFRESIEKKEIIAERGHPIYLLMVEHTEIAKLLGMLHKIVNELKDSQEENIEKKLVELNTINNYLKGIENHMLREENALFPFLEKHDVVQPPKILWTEHDSLRERLKELNEILVKPFDELSSLKEKLYSLILYIVDLKSSHIYKENKILFPTAVQKLTNEEWREVKNAMDEVGYAEFTPLELTEGSKGKVSEAKTANEEFIKDGNVHFVSGELSTKEIEAIFDTLPVEITFVDKEDRVKYFNKVDKRIFIRTKSVIGRSVQNCHPPKSVHIVEKILSDFKSKKRDLAEFWINQDRNIVYIRYFAVRDTNGNYLGTLEVTQDVTEIRKLQGEKRIYSEE